MYVGYAECDAGGNQQVAIELSFVVERESIPNGQRGNEENGGQWTSF